MTPDRGDEATALRPGVEEILRASVGGKVYRISPRTFRSMERVAGAQQSLRTAWHARRGGVHPARWVAARVARG